MLKFKNVSKTFGEIAALQNLSFEVAKGEFVFLTGPSGAGKTTILRLILKEITLDAGEIIFDGVNITDLATKDIPLLRQTIGVVFQDYKLLPERTIRENVEVALSVIDVAKEEWQERVDKILSLVGLINRSELFPAQLSGGELQRASLARALAVNPKLILADEPTGNLDWETAVGIMEIFERINKEGKTIIMATHNHMLFEKYKKRRIEIEGGKLKGSEKEKSLRDEDEKKEPETVKESGEETKETKKLRVKVEEV